MAANRTPQKKHRSGCLIPLGLYVALLGVGFFATRAPMITDHFDDSVASRFYVATVEETAAGFEYGSLRLNSVRERDPRRPALRFLLPEPEITIDVGDIHHASVIEDHNEWQLIEFNYSNTYTATSIYRAYADRIEPVSFQMISSVGDVFAWALVTMVAVVLYLLVALFNFMRNYRATKQTGAGPPSAPF